MPKNENQKYKLFRLLELFYERTDEEHGVTMTEILDYLDNLGIKAERKSIYDDLYALTELGMTIEKLHRRPQQYTLTGRMFELAELKLLVDAVQSSKFITAERSNALIDKLKLFAGKYGAGALSRQVYVEGRAKTINRATLYTIDAIHTAINNSRQITFRYFSYNSKKERTMHRGGSFYSVSPLSLVWSDENYYLVGYDEEKGDRRIFRVDKMLDAEMLDSFISEEARGEEKSSAEYSKRSFGMYGGEDTLVTLFCREEMANVIVDRFGQEVNLVRCEGGFTVSVRVMISPTFFAWVMGLGSKVRILSPASVRDSFLAELRATIDSYGAGGDSL